VPADAEAAREEALYGSPRGQDRREPSRAQDRNPWSPRHRPRHPFHLGTNYRNSAEIYRHAAAYAERVGLHADLPDAVRTTGVEPVEATVAVLHDGVRAAVGELLQAVDGTVGVVVPVARRAEVEGWVHAWPELEEALTGGDSARLVVLTGLDTKGLEFDGIVVVEPEEIERESVTGRATLYVVLTRATQRLVTLTQG
jgi:hypothetical protein